MDESYLVNRFLEFFQINFFHFLTLQLVIIFFTLLEEVFIDNSYNFNYKIYYRYNC